MPPWLIWLIISGALAVGETFSMALVMVFLAGGAAAGAITAALGGPVVLQVIVALVASAALLGLVRPVARRHLEISDPAITGTDALIGMQAVVLSKVDGADGRVRLNGAEWSARSFDDGQTMPAGTVVRVMEIRGATAVVWQEPVY